MLESSLLDYQFNEKRRQEVEAKKTMRMDESVWSERRAREIEPAVAKTVAVTVPSPFSTAVEVQLSISSVN